MRAFTLPILEQRKWSVMDVLDMGNNLIIATDSKNVVVTGEDEIPRIITTNIDIEEMAAYEDRLLALSSGKVYSIPFSTFYHPAWFFAPSEFNTAGAIRYIESSADRSALYIAADTTRLYVNGVLEEEEASTTRKVLGSGPGQYAEFDGEDVTVFPNNVTLNEGFTGTFSGDNSFFKLSARNKKWVRKLRSVSDEPLAISHRVCMPRGVQPQDIYII
jgi:hypothetical protein